jgi:hypothetical protein
LQKLLAPVQDKGIGVKSLPSGEWKPVAWMKPFDGVYPELDEGLRTGSVKSRKKDPGLRSAPSGLLIWGSITMK